nr:hypothetical protein Iba_chr08cCG7900 [Ipomoea batatas]
MVGEVIDWKGEENQRGNRCSTDSRNITGRNAQRLKLSQVEIIVGNIKAGEIMKIRENPQILKPVERNINLPNSGRRSVNCKHWFRTCRDSNGAAELIPGC